MKEPVEHVLRPRLPWRSPDDPAVTECGYNAGSVATIERDVLATRLKDWGRIRTAMTVCMTCLAAAERHSDWETDPRRALAREIDWEVGWRKQKNGTRLRRELLAIEKLIKQHPDDFATLLKREEWCERKDQ